MLLGHRARERRALGIAQLRRVAAGEPTGQTPHAGHVRELGAADALAQRRELRRAGFLERAGVRAGDGVAMRNHRLERRHVGRRLARPGHLQLRREPAHAREAHRLQRADVAPPQVELVPARREFRRGSEGVMIVVQLLAADQDAPRDDVGRRVGGREVAVAPVVADAVDDAGRHDRDPRHLHRPDRRAERAEQHEIDGEHQADALPRIARVEVALDPVVGRALAVPVERVLVLRLGTVELGAAEEHLANAARLRAVRVLGGLALRVMLAVDRGPLLRHHPGREPEPEPEEVGDRGVQVERAMRGMPVQVDRDRGDRDVRQRKRDDDVAPPGQRHQAVRGQRQEIRGHGQVGGSR